MADAGCTELNAAYTGAIKSICDPTLTGLFLSLAIAATIAILITIAATAVLRQGPPSSTSKYGRLDGSSFLGDNGGMMGARRYASDPLVDDFADPSKSPSYGTSSERARAQRR